MRGKRILLLLLAIILSDYYFVHEMTKINLDIFIIILGVLMGLFWLMIIGVPWYRSPHLLDLKVERVGNNVTIHSESTYIFKTTSQEMIVNQDTPLIYIGNSQDNSLFSTNLFTDFIKNKETRNRVPVGTRGNPGFTNLAKYVHLLEGFELVLDTIPSSAIDKFVPKLEERVALTVGEAPPDDLPEKYHDIGKLDQITSHPNYVSSPPSTSKKIFIIPIAILLFVIPYTILSITVYIEVISNFGEYILSAESRRRRRLLINFVLSPVFIAILLYLVFKILALFGDQKINVTEYNIEVNYSFLSIVSEFSFPKSLGCMIEIKENYEIHLALMKNRSPYYSLRIGELQHPKFIKSLKSDKLATSQMG